MRQILVLALTLALVSADFGVHHHGDQHHHLHHKHHARFFNDVPTGGVMKIMHGVKEMVQNIDMVDVGIFLIMFDLVLFAIFLMTILFPDQSKEGGRMLMEVMPFTSFDPKEGRSLDLNEASETVDNIANMVRTAVDAYSQINSQ